MSQTLDVRIQGESMWPTFRDGDVLTFTLLDGTRWHAGTLFLWPIPSNRKSRWSSGC